MTPELEEILELRALVLELRGDVQRLARLLVQDRLTAPAAPARSAPPPRMHARNRLICDLAVETGLGHTGAAAQEVADIWSGHLPAPSGADDLVRELRRYPPREKRQVWRVMNE